MTAEDVFTNPSVSSWGRRLDLLYHQPITRRLARSVRGVPVLQHRASETLCKKRVVPGPQAARDERRDPDVLARHEDPREVPPALEQRDLQKRLAVDLEEVEGGEDLARPEAAGVGVSLFVHLEVALVLPVVHQYAVD